MSVNDRGRLDAFAELQAVAQGAGDLDAAVGVDPQGVVDAIAPGVFAPALAAKVNRFARRIGEGTGIGPRGDQQGEDGEQHEQRGVDHGDQSPAALQETEVGRPGGADDQRRPITFAAAAEPVVWDTSGVAPGTWVIAGYTWEPPYNLWRRAPWVVRVFDDDSDPALMQPALTIGSTPEVLVEDQEIDLDLCVAADPQATVRIA